MHGDNNVEVMIKISSHYEHPVLNNFLLLQSLILQTLEKIEDKIFDSNI